MTTINLQDYTSKIDQLLEENRLVEVIAHCRHILDRHPLHVETYRLLAKAYLERTENSQAMDLFLRILSADPNDFISHAGLAIIHKQAENLEQAAWHFERAYEIQPYNSAIQGELQEMYLLVHQNRLKKVPLTSGVLARFYLRGELYQQAIQELRRELEEDDERVDLRVLLAEALWWKGNKIEAEEVSRLLLEQLPNCIQANAILAEILLQTGRATEARPYFHRLESLLQPDLTHQDMETAVGQAFTAEGAPSLPKLRELQFLATDQEDATSFTPTADWVTEVPFDAPSLERSQHGDVVIEPESGMHSYDWLIDMNEAGTDDAEPVAVDSDWFIDDREAGKDISRELADLDIVEGDEVQLDEWLTELEGASAESGLEEAISFDAGEESTDPLAEPESAPLETAADRPVINSQFLASEWFAEEDLDDEKPLESGEQDWFVDDDQQERPAEAMEVGAVDSTDAGAPQQEMGTDNLPDWLNESTQDESMEAIQLDFETASDWLQEDTAGLAERAAGQVVDDVGDEEIGLTDWLNADETLAEIDESTDLSADLARLLADDSLPEGELPTTADEAVDESWLAELASGPETIENEEAIDVESAEDLPNWLLMESGLLADAPETKQVDEVVDADSTPDLVAEPDSQVNLFAEEEAILASADAWLNDLSTDEQAENAVSEGAQENLIDDHDETIITSAKAVPAITPVVVDEDDSEKTAEDEWDIQLPADELPDWLSVTDEFTPIEESEKEFMGDNDEKEIGVPSTPDPGKDDESREDQEQMPDWLASLDDLVEPADIVDEPSKGELLPGSEEIIKDSLFAEEELPEWLNDADEEGGAIEDATPDWLAAPPPDDDSDELPEIPVWLQEPMTDDEQAEAPATLIEPTAVEDIESLEMGFTDFIDAVDKYEGDHQDLTTLDELAAEVGEPTTVADSEQEESDLDSLLFADSGGLFIEDELFSGAEDEIGEDAPAIIEEEPSDEFAGLGLTSLLAGMETDAGEEPPVADSDLDMDWLEEISAANDELPSDASGMLEDEAVVDLDWLAKIKDDIEDEQMESTAVVEDEIVSEIDDFQPDVPILEQEGVELPEEVEDDSLPEDWGDAMSWLEDLASQQADPVEELPTVAENLLADKVEEQVEAEEIEETAVAIVANSDLDDLLDAITPLEAEEIAKSEEDARLLDDLMTAADVETEGLTDPLLVMGDEDDSTLWLDSLTAEQLPDLTPETGMNTSQLNALLTDNLAESAEEVVSPEEPGLTAEPDMNEADLEEGLSWLDELAFDAEPSLEDVVSTDDLQEDIEQEPEPQPEQLPELEPEDFSELVDLTEEDLELLESLEFLEREALAATGELLSAQTPVAEISAQELDEALTWIESADDVAPVAEEVEGAPDWLATEIDEAATIDSELNIELTEDSQAELAELEEGDNDALEWLDKMATGELEFDVEMDPPPISPSDDALFETVPDDELLVSETDKIIEEQLELPLAVDQVWEEDEQEEEIEPLVAMDTADELNLDIADLPDDSDEALDWLEQMATGELEFDVEMDPPPISPSDDALFDTVPEDEPLVSETNKIIEEQLELPLAVDQVWEEDEQEQEVEPLAAMDTADELNLDIADLPEDPDDALDWLEQMASGEIEFDIEMEPPPIKPSDDAVFATTSSPEEELVEVEEEQPEITEIAAAMDDIGSVEVVEESLLAADSPTAAEIEEQITPVEELVTPAVFADPLAEVDDAVPEDPDEALAWLEQMSADGATLEIEMEPPPIKPSEDAVFDSTAAVESEGSLVEDAASQPEIAEDLVDVEDTIEGAPVVVQEQTSEARLEMFLENVPEDPDEAMSWLEQMAAEQGEDLEVASDSADEEALELPLPWHDGVEDDDGEAAVEVEPESDIIQLLDSPSSEDEAAADEREAEISWLDTEHGVVSEQPSETSESQSGWLQTLPEMDVDSWLSSEEEASTTVDEQEEIPSIETGPLRPLISTSATGTRLASPLQEETPEVPAIDEARFSTLDSSILVDETQLDTVQAAVNEGNYSVAEDMMQDLVAAGSGLTVLIAELENMVSHHPQEHGFQRLLGDAFMRNGQLQKALDTYRMALDSL